MKKRALAILLATVLCIVPLAACQGNDVKSTTNLQAVNKNDTYISFSAANVPLIDPATSFDEAGSYYLCNVYDPLLRPDHDGIIQPWIATEWEPSDDGLTWTFKIREDVKFHNGEVLTAEDVAFSMNRLITIGQGFAYLFPYVKGAEAIDDTTVVFTLNEPFANFTGCLVRLYIVDKSQILEHKKDGDYDEFGDYGMNWLISADAGSGPYMFEELSGKSYVMCKKYGDYWDGWEENAPDGFKLIGSTEAVSIMTMMSRQELEISDAYQTIESFANLDALDGVDLTYFNSGGNTFLTMNNQKAPTDDEHFRKALAYLVDYSTMVETLYPNCTVAEDLVNSSMVGYTKGNWPYYYDVDKAKQELEQSAYYNSLDSMTVDVYWNPENIEREQFFLVFQSTCAQLGINVKITQASWIQVMEDAASPETTPNCFLVWCTPDYMEAGSMLNAQWTIQDIGTWYTMDWIDNTEIDAIIKESLYELDDEKRVDMYKQAIQMLIDSCSTVPVVEMYETHAYQTGYFYWEAAERVKNGESVCPVMGYMMDVRRMKIYPDRR